MEARFQQFYDFISQLETNEKLLVANALNLTNRSTELQDQIKSDLSLRDFAISGALRIIIDPETTTTDINSGITRRLVNVSVAIDATDEVCTWFNGTFADLLEITDDANPHYASIGSADLVFQNGVAQVLITLDLTKATTDDTDTLTVKTIKICGYDYAGGTSVNTITEET